MVVVWAGFASPSPQVAAPILIERKNELEQAHLIVAAPWPSARSPQRYAASMLGIIMGGGTSSRLWQSIREQRGLAYSIGAGGNTYMDVGMFTIYAGTSPAQMDEVLDLSLAEVRRIVREPVSEPELQSAKEQAVSSVLLSLESSSARAGTLARQEMVHGRRIAPDEIIGQHFSKFYSDIDRANGRKLGRTFIDFLRGHFPAAFGEHAPAASSSLLVT